MAINVFDPEYIAKVGFPIAAFVAAFGVVTMITTLIIKSQIKRQEQLDKQYFTNLYNTLDKYDRSLKDIHDGLTNVVIEARIISTKIDTYVNKLDQHFESKSVAYIFREDKIGKIKNIQNIEEIDVTKDIERKVLDKTITDKDNQP